MSVKVPDFVDVDRIADDALEAFFVSVNAALVEATGRPCWGDVDPLMHHHMLSLAREWVRSYALNCPSIAALNEEEWS